MEEFEAGSPDRDYYETGSTKPPKNHSGIIAILLIAMVIYIGGYRLADRLNGQEQDPGTTYAFGQAALSDSVSAKTENRNLSPQRATAPTGEYEMILETSPLSVANVPQEDGLSLQEIYEKAVVSVVSITCTSPRGSASGSGVILSENGYVVTNCHVVEDGSAYTVLLHDGRELEAELVGTDAVSDLAVLKVDAQGLTPAQFGDSSVLRVGDTVVAIGDPLGIDLRGTMTDGIVCGINRDITADGRTMTLIQTNAALNSGNSGGPLLNCYGQVVGINTMKISASVGQSSVEGLGFAIPSTTVKDIVDQLVTRGCVSGRPGLGFTGGTVGDFYQLYYHLPAGVYVESIIAGGAADRGGLRASDIIIALDGERIYTMEALQRLLYSHQAGDEVSLTVSRGGETITLRLTVDEGTK